VKTHGIHFRELSHTVCDDLRVRSAFELGKWDQQFTDHPSLADFVIELDPEVYRQLCKWAESMAGELLRAEREILARPELLARLALPRSICRALRDRPSDEGTSPRLCRFDFHPTEDGWKISEVNSDVPGGLLESDGLPLLLRDALPDVTPLPSTTAAYIEALLAEGPHPFPLGLVHATAYTDDRQVMLYLQRELTARGQPSVLLSPDNLQWDAGGIHARTEWYSGELSRIVRFFPGEWMANLPAACRWRDSPGIGCRWMSNPLQALISQSKRFPLTWPDLREPMATWRRLLPETRAFRRSLLLDRKHWLIKPAFGRVGEGIFYSKVSSPRASRGILLDAALAPRHWVAQRPFRATSWDIAGVPHWPCLGLYTVNERAAGIYARTASKPLVDSAARDTAVVFPASMPTVNSTSYETAGAL
jgi:glutathionylspermidine synthase